LKNLKELSERLTASADAKKLLLKKFDNAPKPTDPEMVAKRAEREAIVAAREIRRAEKERLAQEELARKQAEAEELAAAALAEAEAAKIEANRHVARVLADEAERKAERDRRYAARKAKQR
jgi:hypothetical protein